MGGNEAASFLTEPLAELRIAGQLQDSLGEGAGIVGFDKESGDVVATNLGCSIQVESYHRPTRGHCLRDGARESFTTGEVDERIHEGKVTGHVRGRDEAGKAEMALQAKVPDCGLEPVAPRSVPDEEETDVGTAGDDGRGDGEKVIVAFEREQAGDFSNDEVGGFEVEPRAQVRIWQSPKKRLEIKAAVDTGILPRLPDAGLQVLVDHGIGDRDEVGGGVGGALFGGAECEVGKGTLERPKGGAMDGMDDDRDTGTMSGQTA
jgi:hypothetical protein